MGNTFDGRLLDERQGTSFGRWPTGFRRGGAACGAGTWDTEPLAHLA